MQVTIELKDKHIEMLEKEIGIIIQDNTDVEYAIQTLIEHNEVD